FLLVADILLHETIHQYQTEVSGQTEEGYSGHGPHFRDLANKIGAKLGLPPVRTGKKRGKEKDLPSCSYWPHIVRPAEYYQGAYTRDFGQAEATKLSISLLSAQEAAAAIVKCADADYARDLITELRAILKRPQQ